MKGEWLALALLVDSEPGKAAAHACPTLTTNASSCPIASPTFLPPHANPHFLPQQALSHEATLKGHSSSVRALAVGPTDGSGNWLLATASWGSTIRMWKMPGPKGK